MMRRQTRTLRIVSACVVSGLAAGLLSATQCQYADSDCRIAALAAFSLDPVPWTLWLHWINWLPGLVFGLLFALAAMPWAPFSGRRALLYAIASAAIYLVAGLVFSAFLGVAGQDEFSLIVWIWPAGFVAGLLGALLLSLAGNQLLHPPNSAAGFFQATPLPAAAGAILGVLFVLICSFGEQQIFISFPLAFVAWQVGVGLALATPPGHRPVQRV
jgi:hypothetical protein